MAFLNVKNRAKSTLASGIDNAVTELTVATGQGVKFPTTNFHITIEDEILLCSSRSTDVLTVVRAQEGTDAAAHTAGKTVELRITAKIIQDLIDRGFLSLADTPSSYSGQAEKVVLVNAEEDALEFGTGGGGVSAFLGLTDTPASYSGQAGKAVLVNAGENALEFGAVDAANKALSNLENVAINTSLISDTDNTDSLGSLSKRWDIVLSGKIQYDNDNYIVIGKDNAYRIDYHSKETHRFYSSNYNWSFRTTSTETRFYPRATKLQIVGSFYPETDSAYNSGRPTNYWLGGYFDIVYVNATAKISGATAGHLLFTGDLVPATDNLEWIGQLESPFKAIKGMIIKDTTDGKHYKVEVVNGALTVTALD